MPEAYFRNREISSRYYKEYRLQRYLKLFLKNFPRKIRILDIGCGLGQLMSALHKEGFLNIEGIDISQEAIEICRKNGLKASCIDSIDTFATSCNQKYDLIIMSHVLEHLSKDKIIPTLDTIFNNLLTNKGSFLCIVPNAQSNTGCYWAYEDFTHNTLFTAGSLIYVLKSAGFSKVEIIDKRGLAGINIIIKTIFILLQNLYALRFKFWNLVTLSYFHKPSPIVFTYEIKALAKK